MSPEVPYEAGVAFSPLFTHPLFLSAAERPRRGPLFEGVVVSPTIIKEVAP